MEGSLPSWDRLEAAAESVANGQGWLLDEFASIARGSGGVVDIDFARHGANAWVVGVDESGAWWEGRVELDRDASRRWVSGATSTTTWAGWHELTAVRPARAWPEWGPILGLGFETGIGSMSTRRFLSVHGVAALEVAAIEFGHAGRTRRRPIDTPTGGFIVTVPVAGIEALPVLRVIYSDGSTVDLKR
jgi:hypothetical protein